MELLPAIETYLNRCRMLRPAETLVVGVSGGPDSVALLHLLYRLSGPWRLRLHVAHLHHGIRGAEADADAAFVAALAARWQLPYTQERVALPALAAQGKLALEEAARRARYAFLARVALCVGAEAIAVGHNADDQAETVLMHLLRGAGPAGLRGMLPVTPLHDYRLLPPELAPETPLRLLRPLLETSRADIEAYCAVQGLEFRFDRSNLDTTFFRNRLRHEVLPYLAGLNPRIRQRLQNLAEVVRADYELLEETIDAAWDTLVTRADSQQVSFDLEGWRRQPLAVQRALVRRATYTLRCTLRDVDFAHIEAAVRVGQTGDTGAQATLPHGLRLTVAYELLTIGLPGSPELPRERPWLPRAERIPVNDPGDTALPEGWQIAVVHYETWELAEIRANPDPLCAWLDAAAFPGPLVLRTRQRGDRFQPQGLRGAEVRLSDFFTNAKIPLAWRDHVPLLASGDRVLWVVGWRLSDAALVRPETHRVVQIRLRR